MFSGKFPLELTVAEQPAERRVVFSLASSPFMRAFQGTWQARGDPPSAESRIWPCVFSLASSPFMRVFQGTWRARCDLPCAESVAGGCRLGALCKSTSWLQWWRPVLLDLAVQHRT